MANGSVCLVLLAALSAFGCSSGADSAEQPPQEAPSCEEFTACGGDVVGTWKFRSLCLTDQQQAALNEEVKFCDSDQTTVEPSFEGSVTFERDGSLLRTVTAHFKFEQTVPTSCLRVGATCTTLQSSIAEAPGTSSVTCSKKGSNCECSYQIARASSVQESYSATDAKLAFTSSSDGSKSTADFCVKGSSLSISDEDGIYVLTR